MSLRCGIVGLPNVGSSRPYPRGDGTIQIVRCFDNENGSAAQPVVDSGRGFPRNSGN